MKRFKVLLLPLLAAMAFAAVPASPAQALTQGWSCGYPPPGYMSSLLIAHAQRAHYYKTLALGYPETPTVDMYLQEAQPYYPPGITITPWHYDCLVRTEGPRFVVNTIVSIDASRCGPLYLDGCTAIRIDYFYTWYGWKY